MGIGGGSGGGGFKLEKTWRATGVGTTTFNSPGNFTIPFGKYDILVSGRGGSGTPNTPGTIATYNPTVPSNISGYNPAVSSTISGSNPVTPGNPTGVYNPGSGGNLSGYQQVGGNYAGTNPSYSPQPAFEVYSTAYGTISGFFVPGNLSGAYNPPSGGNSAGYNTNTPGTQNYNPPSPGFSVQTYTYRYFNVNQTYTTYYNTSTAFSCPTPNTYYTYFVYDVTNYSCTPTTIPGNGTGTYNPASGGTQLFNPVTPGTAKYNASQYQAPSNQIFNYYDGVQYSCPTPFTYYSAGAGPGYSSFYETVNFSCTPITIPGTPGNAIYNSVSYTEVYNPYVPGNQNYNSPTGGNSNYNAAVPSTANYNAVGGQNANYNSPTPGVAGEATTVLGVYLPGGNIGSVAPFVSPTLINRYAADDTTYPVTVPTGGYVTIQSR